MSQKNTQTVCIVGLGYVGLPLAIRCSEKGYKTFGFDNNQKKIKSIQANKSPIKEAYIEKNLSRYPISATTNEKVIATSNIIIICVPTPVDKNFYPDLSPVISATKLVAKNVQKGSLVILESTVNPGVSEEIIAPIFQKAGFEIGKDVFIAHCPERINPGDSKWNVTNIPRVVGAFTAAGLEKAVAFYKSIIDGNIRPMKSIREAEAVKIVENSFRDINIAFVNELAKSFDKLEIDVKDVILGAATKPFAFMPHFPSCGVGGHCIPVDPYYLIEKAKRSGFNHKFLRTAREINNSMPIYTVELLKNALNKIGKSLKGTSVGILGVAYKANVDDVRESPAVSIIEEIKKSEAQLNIFDPYIPSQSTVKTLEELLTKSEVLILATDHNEFKNIDPKDFQKHDIKIIIDGKNCLNKEVLEKLDIIYKGIGR